jgi:RND family efflux transporter MFP subunit
MKSLATKMSWLWLLLAVWLAAGCSSSGASDKKEAAKPPVAVDLLQVSGGELTQGIEVVGSLAPKFEASLKAEYQTQVAEVMVAEWVRVNKGQPLARLDTREVQAVAQRARAAVETMRASLLQAQVGLTRAKREHARLLQLKDAGLVTAQALDDARSEEEAAQARQEAAQAQLQVALDEQTQARARLDKAMILSPLEGVVAYRGVNVGDMVGEAGSAKIMFRVVDNRLLDLTVTVPSKEMRHLALGQELTFTTDAFPGQTFRGKVMYINPAVSESDRSLKVIAEVPNPDERLKGGLFVKGRVVVARREGVLMVPRSAFTTWDLTNAKAELWVRQEGQARRRQVGTGAVSGEMVEITGGLTPGEEVVVRGGFNLKDGDRVTLANGNGA